MAQLEKQCEAYLGYKPNTSPCLNTASWLLIFSDNDKQIVCDSHKEELEQRLEKRNLKLRPDEDVVHL